MGKHATQIVFDKSISLDSIQKNLQQYIYGSITLAIVAGVFFGFLTFILLKLFHKRRVPPDKVHST
jgi:xanthine/uracil/vitamin C permease (AzgA family)